MAKKTASGKRSSVVKTPRKVSKPVESGQESSVPDILTIDQAAEHLQLSRSTIYRLINESDLPVKRIGERYRFSRRRLLEWIEK